MFSKNIYFSFRTIHLFNQLTYNFPHSPRSSEVHARLGIVNKALGNYQQAHRHLRIAANDAKDFNLCPRYLLKFHIAHCFELFGEYPRARQEYKRLLDENKPSDGNELPPDLQSAIYRQLGMLLFTFP